MPGAPLPKKAHWPPAYILLQSFVIACVAFYLLRDYQVDDSYISLRYAKNLLEGNGMTWNPGERVEGYSNFLFIVLVAGLGKLGVELVAATYVINFASFGGILFVLARYLRAQPPALHPYGDRVNKALCLGLILSSIPLIAWTVGGLETVLFAFFLCAGICLTLRLLQGAGSNRRAALIGLLFALAALTRPEGALFFAFTMAFLGVVWLKNRSVRFSYLVIAGLAFSAIFIPYMAWRVSYFGEWLPNTYYAKTYGIAPDILRTYGWLYLFQYVFMPPLLVPFALAAFVISARLGRLTPALFYLAAFAVFYLAYIVHVGGDWMKYFRFIAPLVPILALLIYHSGAAMIEKKEKWLRDLCGCLLFFSVLQFGYIMEYEDNAANAISGKAVEHYVKTHWPEGSTVALNVAGYLPYAISNNRYIDMLGLVDKHIARVPVRSLSEVNPSGAIPPGHMKGDGAYILSRKPDYIIMGRTFGNPKPLFPSDIGIFKDPSFLRHYKKVEVYLDPPPELLPLLLYTYAKGKDLGGLMMNGKNQMRFIYYQRKK